MSEERANTKRPPSASADMVDDAGGDQSGRAVRAKVPTEVVTSRFGPEAMDDLALVQKTLRGSRSKVVRMCVGFVAEALRSSSLAKVERTLSKQIAARRPQVLDVDESLLRELIDEIHAHGEVERKLAFQLQKLGSNHNQMVALGNAGRVVDPDAVAGVTRGLAELTDAMRQQTSYGARLRGVETWLSSRS